MVLEGLGAFGLYKIWKKMMKGGVSLDIKEDGDISNDDEEKDIDDTTEDEYEYEDEDEDEDIYDSPTQEEIESYNKYLQEEKYKTDNEDSSALAIKKQKQIEANMGINKDFQSVNTPFAQKYQLDKPLASNTKHSIKSLELSRSKLSEKLNESLDNLIQSAEYAEELELKVAAGHGLNYNNVELICEILEIDELNIGQSIIARSVFIGLSDAIKDMKKLID